MDRSLSFFVSVALILSLVVAAGFAVIVNTGNQTVRNHNAIVEVREAERDSETLLKVLLAVTGCTEDDTPKECADRQEARSLEEGRLRIHEVDCRLRRALEKLPPPKAGTLCRNP